MSNSHLKTALGTGFVILAIQFITIVATYLAFPDWVTRGQFGDVSGTANSLFSGLAFAGLIYAILLQREDLMLQRKELEMTRQELTRSAKAQEQSEIALRAQAMATSKSAQLSATSFLLEHYRQELNTMKKSALMANDSRTSRVQELERRIPVLVASLDAMFNKLTHEGKIDAS